MGGINARIDRLRAVLPAPQPPPDLTPEERDYAHQLEAVLNEILGNLPARYAELVTADLQRLSRTPQPYRDCTSPLRSYYMADVITHLTLAVIEMAQGTLEGWYTGPARFPVVVCEALDHLNGDAFTEENYPHGHVPPPPFWDDSCPACAFRWLNRRLRDSLDTCPACNHVWPPRVCGHDRSTLIGSREWVHIAADQTQNERRRVGTQAVARMGTDGARKWLTDTLELEPAIVEAVLAAASVETSAA